MFTHELHDEVQFVGGLEGVGESDQEGMVDVLEDHFLCFCVLDLILLDYVVLVDRFHSEEFLRVLLLHQQNSAESSLSEYNLRHEIVDSNFFLEIIPRVKGLGGFSDHFLLLLLALKILLERDIIMKYEIPLNLLDTLLLLLLFSGRIVDQVQFFSVVNRQFLTSGHSERLQQEVNDLIPPISRRIPAYVKFNL